MVIQLLLPCKILSNCDLVIILNYTNHKLCQGKLFEQEL